MQKHHVKRITRNRIWGFGIYINPDPYRYVALQFGPFWIYLYHESDRIMTAKQLSILNALVTYTIENVPGGPREEEKEVAEIVGNWAIKGKIDLEEKRP
jgi:hypothetical protein